MLRALSRNSGKYSVTLGFCLVFTSTFFFFFKGVFTSTYGQRLLHKYINSSSHSCVLDRV